MNRAKYTISVLLHLDVAGQIKNIFERGIGETIDKRKSCSHEKLVYAKHPATNYLVKF